MNIRYPIYEGVYRILTLYIWFVIIGKLFKPAFFFFYPEG